MRTGSPHIKETGAAIAVYLAVCMFVYGFFGFGFYKMFQPLQFPNPGLAAYKPPPATVITYAAAAKFSYGEPAPSETTSDEPSHGASDETTRAYASATPLVTEPPTPVAHMPVPQEKREAATRPAKVRRVEAKARQAHSSRAERTTSSRAHSETRSVAAAYPGFAAVR
jgi:hypothetical protein